MPESKQETVERLARQGVDKALAEDERERREFTITKFGRHENSYFHARVTIAGTSYYVHRRYGSWMAPGEQGGRAVLKEIDALIGRNAIDVKTALQTKARAIEKAERRERGETDAPAADDSSDDEPVASASAAG